MILITLIIIYLTQTVQVSTKNTPQFLRYKSLKLELDNVSFQHVNIHCLPKQFYEQNDDVMFMFFHNFS